MKILKIREEIFGATLFFSDSGKRVYINKKELNQIKKNNIFPKDLQNNQNYEIDYIPLGNVYSNDKFSFANIAYIELTRKCNLHCVHCLNNSGKTLKNELSYNQWLKIINNLNKAGIQEIRFTGGEPLLYEKLFDLIKVCTKKGIYVSLGTNATLISDDIARKLKKVGLKKAIVSIDGTEKTHDLIRGTNAYNRAMNGLECLINNNIDFKINSVIMKKNMEDIINFSKEMYIKKYPLFIRRFIESGRGEKLNNYILSDRDYNYIEEKLKDIIDESNIIRGHYLKLKDDDINERIKIPFDLKYGCKVAQRALVILPNGEIQYCGFLAAQGFPSLGNATKITDFRDFWVNLDNDKRLEILSKRLNKYNKLNCIKKTNCLAYAMGNNKKKFIIIISKDNLFTEQIRKIKNESIVNTSIIVIENFCKKREILKLNSHDIVYFACCNSNLVNKAISLIDGGYIINKNYLKSEYRKKDIQLKSINNNIVVPNLYSDIKNVLFPVMCKQNIHQGISFKAFNMVTLNRFFKKFDYNDFYLEESIPSFNEIKIYYINGLIFSKKDNINIPLELFRICKNISNVFNNIEVYSADFIFFKNNYYLIDLNASAGFYQSNIAREEFLNYMVDL